MNSLAILEGHGLLVSVGDEEVLEFYRVSGESADRVEIRKLP